MTIDLRGDATAVPPAPPRDREDQAGPMILVRVDARSPTGAFLASLAETGYEGWRVDDHELLAPGAGLPNVVGASDHLFVPGRTPPAVAGWTAGPVRFDVVVADLVRQASSSNDDERAYAASAMAEANSALLGDETVRRALDALARDPVDRVRTAAAWWPERRPGPEGGLSLLRDRSLAAIRSLLRRSG